MRRVLRWTAAVGLVALWGFGDVPLAAADASPVPSQADSRPLAFSDADVLVIEIPPQRGKSLTTDVSVAMRNDTASPVTVSFALLLMDPSGKKVELKPPTTTDSKIGPGSARWITVTITEDTERGNLTGFLVGMATGVPAATRPVAITNPHAPFAHLPLGIIVGAFLGGVLALLFAAAWLPGGVAVLMKRMGPAEFKPNESWASTIAGAGGLVGAFGAGSGFLPDKTHLMSKGEFAGLALLFAALPVIAAFAYATFTTTARNAKKLQEQGFVLTFLLAGSLAVAAVIGQTLTLAALVADASSGEIAESLSRSFYVLLAVALLLSVLYGVIQMRRKVSARLAIPRRGTPRTYIMHAAAEAPDGTIANEELLSGWSLL